MLLHEFIEATARRSPAATAVCSRDATLTYAELDGTAERVAAALENWYAVGPGDVVALALPTSLEWLAVIIGVLKTGAAYLPMDPAFSSDRVGFMLDDSRARLLIGGATSVPGVPLIQPATLTTAHVSRKDGERARPEDVAYVIYTSGSTGRPKGVAVEHRHITASLIARFAHYRANPEVLMLPFSPAFDGVIGTMYWTLAGGGCVYFPPAILDGTITDLLYAQGCGRAVTDICVVPSMYQRILDHAEPELIAGLRRVIVAGEACRPSLVRHHLAVAAHATLHNEYGPTEAAVWSTVHDCGLDDIESVPIGQPIWSATAFVLDEQWRPVPPGDIGELYIGGAGVARGYIGHPGLTAERFVPAPDGSRLYRTGDLVRLDGRANLEFLGRNDHQIKWKGYRIEPGEIEVPLAALAGVAEVAVVLSDYPRTLVAYAVATVSGERMLDAIRGTVADYMLPTQVVVLPTLPHTPNGKIDRAALAARPLIRAAEPADGEDRGDATADETEREIAHLVAAVLELPHVPRDADFFQLGADSMTIIQLASAVNQSGYPVTARQIFLAPTLSGLTGLVRASRP